MKETKMINKKVPLGVIPSIKNENIMVSRELSLSKVSPDSCLSLYIHFPFCVEKCVFCPIKTMIYNSRIVEKYLVSLKNEIVSTLKQIGYLRVDNIHFGGGTPSLLKVNELDEILNIIKRYANIDDAEIIFEAHPAFITDEMLSYLSQIGKCTINFGVQSFDNKILTSTKRCCKNNDMIRTIYLAKEKNNIVVGIDYICGWPNSDYNMIEEDIRFLELIKPEHISQYPLQTNGLNTLCVQNQDAVNIKIELNKYCESMISGLGYQRYSISHYQRKGSFSHRYGRNQLCGGEWLGFGANACSYIGDSVYVNSNILEYVNGNSLYEKAILNEKEKLIWELIFLFRNNPLSRNDIVEKYGLKINRYLDEIIKIFDDNRYIISKQNLSLSWLGIISMDCVENIINTVFSYSSRDGLLIETV